MLRSIAAECECSCSHSRSALRCVSKHEDAHIGSSSSFETRARPFVLCGFSSACALLRMRTASRLRPYSYLTMSNSPSRSRGACLRPGFATLLRQPESRGGRSAERRLGARRNTRGACHLASKTRVNTLMTRHGQALARRLASHDAAIHEPKSSTISMKPGASVPIVSQNRDRPNETGFPSLLAPHIGCME
jgi:hypothetical protein